MDQFILFLFSFALGFVLGAFYELLCAIARLTGHTWVQYCLDVFFGFAVVVSFIFLTVWLTSGTFYAFMASSTLAGLALFILVKDKIKQKREKLKTRKSLQNEA